MYRNRPFRNVRCATAQRYQSVSPLSFGQFQSYLPSTLIASNVYHRARWVLAWLL